MKIPYEECVFDLDITPFQELFSLAYGRLRRKFDRNYVSPPSVARGIFRQYLKKKIGAYLGHPYTVDPYLSFAYSLLANTADPVVIDIGANIGTTVLPLAKRVPAAKIFAVEPHPENQSKLIRNQKLNGLSNIISLSTAIGGSDCEFLEMVHHSTNEGGHHVLDRGPHSVKSGCFVTSVSLKDIFSFFNLTHCDLLKVDTEGFDYHVLQTLEDLAHPKIVKHIVVECNPEGLHRVGKSPKDLIEFGLQRGYVCKLLDDQKIITSEKDLPHIPQDHVLDFLLIPKNEGNFKLRTAHEIAYDWARRMEMSSKIVIEAAEKGISLSDEEVKQKILEMENSEISPPTFRQMSAKLGKKQPKGENRAILQQSQEV